MSKKKDNKKRRVSPLFQPLTESPVVKVAAVHNEEAIRAVAGWLGEEGRLSFASMAVKGKSDTMSTQAMDCLGVLGLESDIVAWRAAQERRQAICPPTQSYGRLDIANVAIVQSVRGQAEVIGLCYFFSVRGVTFDERAMAHWVLRPDMEKSEFLENPSMLHFVACDDPEIGRLQIGVYEVLANVISGVQKAGGKP